MQITAKQLIDQYIGFFESHGHVQIPSAPLIPENDPTVLFTTAGMHPLVPYLMGEKHPCGTRLVDYQRCVRTGDIDEVGDATHNTFFTMLGNWSLGDYFKQEAITWSFSFLTEQLYIPLSHLAFTVYQGDDVVPRDTESADIWRSLGVSTQRIAYLDRKENWWGPAGQTGPCGPDTEMFYWSADQEPPEDFDPLDDRWVEIWNDVFMQYDKQVDGSYQPLAQQNVDTGLGLERVLMVLQGKQSVYDTELFAPIMSTILSWVEDAKHAHTDVSVQRNVRVIADHVRASAMMIADGVFPSNKDQGYVLRRLIRRVVRIARTLEVTVIQDMIAQTAMASVQTMQPLYTHLDGQEKTITDVLIQEVQKFEKTLANGLQELKKMWDAQGKITGTDAFNLYQSYGFPIELTQEVVAEYGQVIDKQKFQEEFCKHQELSRAGAAQKFEGGLADHSAETVRLHTATHLMHKALKNVLGEDVQQKGSNITAKRLRFDFNYPQKLTSEQIAQVEQVVNEQIKKGLPVYCKELTPAEAKAQDALGYFDDKYATLDKLKVYYVGDDEQGFFSVEICGGPHVSNTQELGSFTITKEESCSAGIRRIKATVSANQTS